jgi:hypothetical protein
MTEIQEHCLNCDTPLQGKFCHACGQKQLEQSERTLKYFVSEFLGSAFLLEKNFLKNLWQVLAKPGQLARHYVEGKRKRYMPPFSIFLLINFFFFIYNPLTDFRLPLRDQFYQPYGSLAKKMVDQKLKEENITFEQYEDEYWNESSMLTESLIILNVPITAFFLSIWFYRRKMFFADHFIFALFLYSFILLFSMLYYLVALQIFMPYERWMHLVFNLSLTIYTFFSVKRFYSSPFKVSPWINTFVILAFLLITHFIYRGILFLTTFALT